MKFAGNNRYGSPGFTLVEIMVAMVIAIIVMGGVYQTLTDETISQEKSEQMLEMQNNARVVLERVVRDIRRAGFMGCGGTDSAPTLLLNYLVGDPDPEVMGSAKIGKMTVATNPPGLAWDGTKSIISTIVDTPVSAVDYLGETLGFSDDAPSTHPLYQAGTDAITLVYLSDERNGTMTGSSSDITLNTSAYKQHDILYISDCENYTLFQKTNSDDTALLKHEFTGLNTSADLGKWYGNGIIARVFKYNTATYFVHKDKFTLCRNQVSTPIASNVEDLQFAFLFDENKNGALNDENWVSSMGAHTSKEVRAIRIWVLVTSEPDFTYTDTNTYNYPNSPYAVSSPAALAPITSPSNGEHRHRFLTSAVVYVRNAGLKLF